jgi:dTDP-4-amino-4,6-dideoxygalactose transaminase
MNQFARLAARHDLRMIEDAAQAHGARFAGRRAGGLGHIGAFSFYPGKNLGAFGDAGALVTDDTSLAETARQLANHGRRQHHLHDLIGTNARLDTLQAAVLMVKLKRLDCWNALRRQHAARYQRAFSDQELIRPVPTPVGQEGVFHHYVVRVPDRDRIRALLNEKEIATGLHYSHPVSSSRHSTPTPTVLIPKPSLWPRRFSRYRSIHSWRTRRSTS